MTSRPSSTSAVTCPPPIRTRKARTGAGRATRSCRPSRRRPADPPPIPGLHPQGHPGDAPRWLRSSTSRRPPMPSRPKRPRIRRPSRRRSTTAPSSSWSPTARTTPSCRRTSTINGKTLWIDAGVTLYASRNPDLYQKTGNCGVLGVNDSGACIDFITVSGDEPRHRRRRHHRRTGRRAADRPRLLVVAAVVRAARDRRQHRQPDADQPARRARPASCSTGSRCTTRRSSTSSSRRRRPTDVPRLAAPGKGFIVWGITHPHALEVDQQPGAAADAAASRATPTASIPGTTDIANCGVIACNTISTGDDHIAIKGGHGVSDV